MKCSLNGFNDEWISEESKKKYEDSYNKNIKKWLDGSKKGRELYKGYEKKSKRK